jgi:hypothetical protein
MLGNNNTQQKDIFNLCNSYLINLYFDETKIQIINQVD